MAKPHNQSNNNINRKTFTEKHIPIIVLLHSANKKFLLHSDESRNVFMI